MCEGRGEGGVSPPSPSPTDHSNDSWGGRFMARKVDFKQMLLEKGERVGLAVAAGIMVLLLVVGAYGGLSRESPSETTAEISSNAKNIQETLDRHLSDDEKKQVKLTPDVD